MTWEPAAAVRRSRVRTVAHSACHAPSGRSSTASAAARCTVAASWGVVSAVRRTSTDSTGLALCGIVDDPPPLPSDSSPTSGRQSSSTSPARWPQASVQVTAASARRVSGERVVCQGGRGARSSACTTCCATAADVATGSGWVDASSTVAARVPAAPPSWAGKDSASTVSTASRTPVSQPAALSPKVVGTACWVRVRATIGVARCSSTRPASRRRLPGEVGADRSEGVADGEEQGGVDHVLAGEAAVQPAGRVGVAPLDPFAEQRDQRGRGVAAGLGGPGQVVDVPVVHQAVQLVLRRGRCDPRGHQRVQPRRLDGGHRLEEGAPGEQVAGALVARPEQVTHAVSVADG